MVINWSIHIFGIISHKFWVFIHLFVFSMKLIWRGVIHDNSKFTYWEAKDFMKYIRKLRRTPFGSSKYNKLLKKLEPAILHHRGLNRHHPEYFSNGIKGMNLVDIVEMFCDWKASVRRHETGSIKRSVEICGEKFKIGYYLLQILRNTAGGE